MTTRTGLWRRRAGPGFTLIELLLATVLLLLLAGAVVFNFAVLQRGAALEEGTTQFEALLRFARAHAANTGRTVQLRLEANSDVEGFTWLGNAHLGWEPDQLERPGLFEEVLEVGPYLEKINGLIRVESLRVLEAIQPDLGGASSGSSSNQIDRADDAAETPSPIRFYPDGSSDSAEFILASQSDDDQRRMAVRIEGVTGGIRRDVRGSFETKSDDQTQTNAEANPGQTATTRRQEKPPVTLALPPPKPAVADTLKSPSDLRQEPPGK